MHAANPFELLARWGYGARGVVYLIIGGIALTTAFHGGGESPDPNRALSTVLAQPFGRILLGAIALGLVGHVLWRLAQAILNADDRKDDAKGITARVAQLASGIAHAGLAFAAVRLALGSGGGRGSGGEKGLAGWLMAQPFGAIAAMLLGAVVIAAGAAQIKRGVMGDYRDWIKLPPDREALLRPVCAYGLAARGALFVIAGGFLIYAGWTVSPEQAGSLTDALDWVRGLPFGQILFGLAALGLFAFGAYSVVEAIYRRVGTPHLDKARHAIAAKLT